MKKTKPKRTAAARANREQPTGMHNADHSEQSSACAICRLRTLKVAADAGDVEAAGALFGVAIEAAEALEDLREQGNEFILALLGSMQVWPVNVTYPDGKRDWLKQLGATSSSFPFAWRAMLHKDTLSRRILIRSFELIAALRDYAIDEEVERDRKLARPIDDVIPAQTLDVRPYLEDEVAMASFREDVRRTLAERQHPETVQAPSSPALNVGQAFNELLSVLDLPSDNPHALTKTFAPLARALRHSSEIGAWFVLAKQILFFVTGDSPETNQVLRSLAPGRGVRKTNRFDKPRENVKEIRRRIFDDMLEAPLKRVVGSASDA